MPELTLMPTAGSIARFALLLSCFAFGASAQPAAVLAQEYDEPLITAEEWAEWDQTSDNKRLAFRRALNSANPTVEEQELLREGARAYVYGLTVEAIREDLPQVITNSLMQDIYGLASENGRRIVCHAIVDLAPDFLPDEESGQKGQPPIVRLNLAIMLRRLNIRTSDARQAAVPFVPARTALLMILNDPTTRTDAKIWAADGLGRICREAQPGVTDGDLQIVDRSEIGVALANALKSEEAINDDTRHYALRLVEALGHCGLSLTATRQPVMVEALMNRLVDQNEHEVVRAMAALSLSEFGRVNDSSGLNAPVNFQLIFYETMRLAGELTQRMQQGPGEHTRRALIYIYFSFKGEKPSQAAQQRIGWLNQVQRAGLGQHRDMVQTAYDAMLPVFQEVARTPDPNITPQMVQAVQDWLGDPTNIPADRKLTPDSDPLPEIAEDGAQEGGPN